MTSHLNLLTIIFSLWISDTNAHPESIVSEGNSVGSNVIINTETLVIDISKKNQLEVQKSGELIVLNEHGDGFGSVYLFYDPTIKIKKASIKYYNSKGVMIKELSLRDFSDQSAISDYSLYEDDRIKYYTNTPKHYPYRVEYSYTYNSTNTLFLPSWNPVKDYNVSVLESKFIIKHAIDTEFNKLEKNFDSFNIEVNQTEEELNYTATDIKPLSYEPHSLPLNSKVPELKIAPKEFIFEGIKGEFNNWNDVGKWIHSELLEGTGELPKDAILEISELTADVTDDSEKVRLVYEYVQNHCRYISVQIGIGGWRPIPAKKVHKSGYGDCKALVNYTKALLNVANVSSYYSIVYAGKKPKDIEVDYFSFQGNHAILLVPIEQDTLWLECTSTNAPAGYISGFTDDRDVFTVYPDGGKILHTKSYLDSLNTKVTSAECLLDASGNLKMKINSLNKGSYYGKHAFLDKLKTDQIDKHYKNLWEISGLHINDTEFLNEKSKEELHENLELEIESYASNMGNMTILKPFILDEGIKTKKNTLTEKQELFYLDISENKIDKFIITASEGMAFSSLPEPVMYDYSFGSYFFSLESLEPNKIKVTRHFKLNKGTYPAKDYENYKSFLEAIWKNDNAKILLQST